MDQLEQFRCVGEVAVVRKSNGAYRGGTEVGCAFSQRLPVVE